MGISRSSVQRIKHQKKINPVVCSPGKKRSRRKIKTSDLPVSFKMNIRFALYKMYEESEFTIINKNITPNK